MLFDRADEELPQGLQVVNEHAVSIVTLLIGVVPGLVGERLGKSRVLAESSASLGSSRGWLRLCVLLFHRGILVEVGVQVDAFLLGNQVELVAVYVIELLLPVAEERLDEHLVEVDDVALNLFVTISLNIFLYQKNLRIPLLRWCFAFVAFGMSLLVQSCILVAVLFLEELEIFLVELWWDALVVRNVFVHLHHTPRLVVSTVGRATSSGVLGLLVYCHVVRKAAVIVSAGAEVQVTVGGSHVDTLGPSHVLRLDAATESAWLYRM